MTLRNAGENRRLEGQIKTLDSQLRQNLVSLQAEIMAVKDSPYAARRSHSRSPARRSREAAELAPRRPRTPERDTTRGRNREPYFARRVPTPDPRKGVYSVVNGQQHHSPKLPRIHISQNESAGSFLPEIRSGENFLVTRGAGRCVASPAGRRGSGGSLFASPLAVPSNLHRPRSLPSLATADDGVLNATGKQLGPGNDQSATAQSCYAEKAKTLPGSGARKLERGSDRVHSKDSSPVRDSGTLPEHGAQGEGGGGELSSRRNSEDGARATSEEEPGEEPRRDSDEDEEGSPRAFHSDEDLSLFRNSLLIKAARADSLSGSLPDLKRLGFMDFNEAIDERLRKLQQEIPSAEEMRKIRYLRLPDEPPTPDILTVFDKDS